MNLAVMNQYIVKVHQRIHTSGKDVLYDIVSYKRTRIQ